MTLKHLDEQHFSAVEEPGITALIDFYADWCGPCKMIGPIVEELARELPNILVGKVDIDRYPGLAKRFDVQSIPTVLILVSGHEKQRTVGFASKAKLLSMLETARE